MREAIRPIPPRKSQYGIAPELVKRRLADYPDIRSVLVSDLFPETPPVIYPGPGGLEAVRRATEGAMDRLDLSMIKPGHSVNVLASHHGFTLVGGEAYAEMLRTIRQVIVKRTGCANVRLRAGVGLRFRETEEYIERFGLKADYQGRALGIAPVDEGIAIETEVGTLYGLRRAYDADWIVHAHNSDVREVHFHRQVDKVVKPFGMSYARIETRSTYHQNLGPRAANFIARAIFDAPFVQKKFAFAAFLVATPSGIVGVDADNDLYLLNDRITLFGCENYGKMMTLLGTIDQCVAVLDFPCPVPYVFSAGVIYANFVGANLDLFDLDAPLPPYTWYTEAFYGRRGPLVEEVPPLNPAVRMCLHNYAWVGYPSAFFSEHIPTVVVGEEQARLFDRDPQNLTYMKHAVVAGDTDAALAFCQKAAKTDCILVFDGAVGGVNASQSLVRNLQQAAPQVAQTVEERLLPKWLRQRGIDPDRVERFQP
ncbi:MAG: hypothetical protein AB1445_05460 [Bacillota bacterium]